MFMLSNTRSASPAAYRDRPTGRHVRQPARVRDRHGHYGGPTPRSCELEAAAGRFVCPRSPVPPEIEQHPGPHRASMRSGGTSGLENGLGKWRGQGGPSPCPSHECFKTDHKTTRNDIREREREGERENPFPKYARARPPTGTVSASPLPHPCSPLPSRRPPSVGWSRLHHQPVEVGPPAVRALPLPEVGHLARGDQPPERLGHYGPGVPTPTEFLCRVRREVPAPDPAVTCQPGADHC